MSTFVKHGLKTPMTQKSDFNFLRLLAGLCKNSLLNKIYCLTLKNKHALTHGSPEHCNFVFKQKLKTRDYQGAKTT